MSNRPVAFVTGASRGIGRGIVLALAHCGFDIVGNATTHDPQNREAGLAEVQDRVEELGTDFQPAPGDIARLDGHESLLSVALERFGRVDVLVNNAGITSQQRLDVLDATPDSFDQVLAVNTRGTFFLTQRFARQMVKQVGANPGTTPMIIFVSSVSASASSPSRAAYCISKAAISQAAAIFADRLAEFGINVYEVRPGIIRTDMTAPMKQQYDARIAEGLVPQKRWGLPEDVGRAVAALARGDFAYSTGLAVEVSGGMNIRRL
jgi:3-oxoacyl-[acyl-carrier protein] reductase